VTLALLQRANAPNLKHILKLELCGSGQSGVLRQHWTFMVVITALKVWATHHSGNTNMAAVTIGGASGSK
jgi:hypothetical protein